jgi:hypothetical protein
LPVPLCDPRTRWLADSLGILDKPAYEVSAKIWGKPDEDLVDLPFSDERDKRLIEIVRVAAQPCAQERRDPFVIDQETARLPSRTGRSVGWPQASTDATPRPHASASERRSGGQP